jgi:hypothetical protein
VVQDDTTQKTWYFRSGCHSFLVIVPAFVTVAKIPGNSTALSGFL